MTPDEYIDVMGGLSVLELSELVKQFEDKFNVKASNSDDLIILQDKKDTEWYRKFEKKKKSTRIK